MKSIQKFLLFLLFVTSSSSLFSVIVDYRHVKVGGKDVYLLGDHHAYCSTGQNEAKELLHYLFSKEKSPAKIAFILEENEKSIKDYYSFLEEKAEQKDSQINRISYNLLVKKTNVMLSVVRHLCYLYSSDLNRQISCVFGDVRGSELMKSYELRDISLLEPELVNVLNNSLSMLLNPCFPREFVEKNLGKIKNIIKEIKVADSSSLYMKKVCELTDVYFYIQIQFYLLTHDKVVLYAGALHTEVVANMLLENEEAKLVKHVNDHHLLINEMHINHVDMLIEIYGLEVYNRLPHNLKSFIDFEKPSIVSEFLPEIFGISVHSESRMHFLRSVFEKRVKEVALESEAAFKSIVNLKAVIAICGIIAVASAVWQLK